MDIKDLRIVNPYDFEDHQCPIFVQSADIKSLFGWGIRKRIKSNWNHSMIMRKAEHLVSQNKTYREIDVGDYMETGQLMKFWICKDITDYERNAIMIKIQHELAKPWHKRLYDWPGIIGQFFGLRWFNVPGLNYCSERVSSKVSCILPNVPKHPTPEDLDKLYEESDRMECVGYYFNV